MKLLKSEIDSLNPKIVLNKATGLLESGKMQ